MKKTLLFTITSIALFAASVGYAEETQNQETASKKREQVIDTREANQQKRIEQGVKSGQLTGAEAAKLEKREDHIIKIEKNAMKDGKISKKEFKHIEKAQDRTSEAIYKKKHNNNENHIGNQSAKKRRR